MVNLLNKITYMTCCASPYYANRVRVSVITANKLPELGLYCFVINFSWNFVLDHPKTDFKSISTRAVVVVSMILKLVHDGMLVYRHCSA